MLYYKMENEHSTWSKGDFIYVFIGNAYTARAVYKIVGIFKPMGNGKYRTIIAKYVSGCDDYGNVITLIFSDAEQKYKQNKPFEQDVEIQRIVSNFVLQYVKSTALKLAYTSISDSNFPNNGGIKIFLREEGNVKSNMSDLLLNDHPIKEYTLTPFHSIIGKPPVKSEDQQTQYTASPHLEGQYYSVYFWATHAEISFGRVMVITHDATTPYGLYLEYVADNNTHWPVVKFEWLGSDGLALSAEQSRVVRKLTNIIGKQPLTNLALAKGTADKNVIVCDCIEYVDMLVSYTKIEGTTKYVKKFIRVDAHRPYNLEEFVMICCSDGANPYPWVKRLKNPFPWMSRGDDLYSSFFLSTPDEDIDLRLRKKNLPKFTKNFQVNIQLSTSEIGNKITFIKTGPTVTIYFAKTIDIEQNIPNTSGTSLESTIVETRERHPPNFFNIKGNNLLKTVVRTVVKKERMENNWDYIKKHIIKMTIKIKNVLVQKSEDSVSGADTKFNITPDYVYKNKGQTLIELLNSHWPGEVFSKQHTGIEIKICKRSRPPSEVECSVRLFMPRVVSNRFGEEHLPHGTDMVIVNTTIVLPSTYKRLYLKYKDIESMVDIKKWTEQDAHKKTPKFMRLVEHLYELCEDVNIYNAGDQSPVKGWTQIINSDEGVHDNLGILILYAEQYEDFKDTIFGDNGVIPIIMGALKQQIEKEASLREKTTHEDYTITRLLRWLWGEIMAKMNNDLWLRTRKKLRNWEEESKNVASVELILGTRDPVTIFSGVSGLSNNVFYTAKWKTKEDTLLLFPGKLECKVYMSDNIELDTFIEQEGLSINAVSALHDIDSSRKDLRTRAQRISNIPLGEGQTPDTDERLRMLRVEDGNLLSEKGQQQFTLSHPKLIELLFTLDKLDKQHHIRSGGGDMKEDDEETVGWLELYDKVTRMLDAIKKQDATDKGGGEGEERATKHAKITSSVHECCVCSLEGANVWLSVCKHKYHSTCFLKTFRARHREIETNYLVNLNAPCSNIYSQTSDSDISLPAQSQRSVHEYLKFSKEKSTEPYLTGYHLSHTTDLREWSYQGREIKTGMKFKNMRARDIPSMIVGDTSLKCAACRYPCAPKYSIIEPIVDAHGNFAGETIKDAKEYTLLASTNIEELGPPDKSEDEGMKLSVKLIKMKLSLEKGYDMWECKSTKTPTHGGQTCADRHDAAQNDPGRTGGYGILNLVGDTTCTACHNEQKDKEFQLMSADTVKSLSIGGRWLPCTDSWWKAYVDFYKVHGNEELPWNMPESLPRFSDSDWKYSKLENELRDPLFKFIPDSDGRAKSLDRLREMQKELLPAYSKLSESPKKIVVDQRWMFRGFSQDITLNNGATVGDLLKAINLDKNHFVSSISILGGTILVYDGTQDIATPLSGIIKKPWYVDGEWPQGENFILNFLFKSETVLAKSVRICFEFKSISQNWFGTNDQYMILDHDVPILFPYIEIDYFLQFKENRTKFSLLGHLKEKYGRLLHTIGKDYYSNGNFTNLVKYGKVYEQGGVLREDELVNLDYESYEQFFEGCGTMVVNDTMTELLSDGPQEFFKVILYFKLPEEEGSSTDDDSEKVRSDTDSDPEVLDE